ncbi:hypothetical protein Q0812_10200 [Brevundimonas sp. 2R-24]|uniref:Uncharacterized protein n=1 Tax=Peiella sedimenti TaxID=3061083 RepID=A0ABT8SMK0_9CAUL|nr:hypothetical protein [Caulobacteraceae bacterium XZ-24]
METYIVGFGVPLLTGMAWLAYAHPEAYAKVHGPLMILFGLAFFGAGGISVGIYMSLGELASRLDGDAYRMIAPWGGSVRSTLGKVMFGCGSLVFYSHLLAGLPLLLKKPSAA